MKPKETISEFRRLLRYVRPHSVRLVVGIFALAVAGLGEGLVEKLKAAGVNTVESLADMTPEQLEAIEGIGPKTVEKISIAVNNYFATLDGGEAVATTEPESAEEAASSGEAVAEGSIEEGSVEADALAAAAETVEDTAPPEESAERLSAEAAPEESLSDESASADPATEEAPEEKQN